VRAAAPWIATAVGVTLAFGCKTADEPKEAPAEEPSAPIKTEAALDRTVLPIPEPNPPLYTELDVRNATPPPRFEVKAPEGAPNVVVVLVDDLGFAGTSTFGGPVATPTFDQIAKEGLRYNNFLGLQRFTIAATERLTPGKSTIRFEFAYDGGGVGKGGAGTLFVNDQKVAEGRIERTQPMIFSADETADVGIDLATPVVETIGSVAASRFTGRIPKVTIEVK
jgi:arylsulfatase